MRGGLIHLASVIITNRLTLAYSDKCLDFVWAAKLIGNKLICGPWNKKAMAAKDKIWFTNIGGPHVPQK